MITYYILFIDAVGDVVEALELDATTKEAADAEMLDVVFAGIGEDIEHTFSVLGTEVEYHGDVPVIVVEDLEEALQLAHADDALDD